MKHFLIAVFFFCFASLSHTNARSEGASTPVTKPDAAKSLLLAEAGQSKAIIVLPDAKGRDPEEPSVRMENQASAILADFLGRMTGAKFETVYLSDLGEVKIEGDRIASEKRPAANYIVIGQSDLSRRLKFPAAATEAGATFVRAAGNTILIMGAPDGSPYLGGAVYSAYAFLESLGCRYLWPGKSGLVIPQKSTLVAAFGTQQFVPPIKQRNMRMSIGYDRAAQGAQMLGIEKAEYSRAYEPAVNVDAKFVERGLGGWEMWQKLGGDIEIAGGHTFGNLYNEQGEAHPGWFALQPDGTRKQKSSERARLCVSNSQLIAHVADGIIARLQKEPNLKSVSLSPNDGGADVFCMCEKNALGEPGCVSLDSPKGRVIKDFRGWNRDYVSLTDRYVYFWNKIAERVAKEKPDLLFVVDAYSYYEAPPVERNLHPNLVVRYVQATLADWDEWSRKSSKIYWRPNILHTPWQVGYAQFNRQWAKDMNYVAHHNGIATDFDSIINSWATEGLNYYVLAKLNYNPDADVNALVDDYCRTGFGAAHKEIRQYFDKVAALTDAQQKVELAGFNDRANSPIHPRPEALAQVYLPADIAALRGYLKAASARAAGDDAVLNRIEFLRVGLDWTDIQSRAYRVLLAWKRKQAVDLIATGKLLEERRTMMREIFRKHPLAVNVSYVYYGDRGYWRDLEKEIEDAQKVEAAKNPTGAGTIIDADENGQPIEVPAIKP